MPPKYNPYEPPPNSVVEAAPTRAAPAGPSDGEGSAPVADATEPAPEPATPDGS